ncbi:sensor histidine kinase [Methanosarcina hadiensis]|uniref:sensor histidine kinase n=1 Tax=Methanosarcina hadiensis TaxID=3078083 RepID=UPI0039775416
MKRCLKPLKRSQNRVVSMALIHEELYKGDRNDTLDFAAYIRKFTADLFSSYNIGNSNINLKTDLESVYLDMDAAVPLGIIINELISNSLKHAFPAGSEGEINISLRRTETLSSRPEESGQNQNFEEKDSYQYILKVADNGKGIPEEVEFQNPDSLGLQLVNILIEQMDGCIELKRNHGTEFSIFFGDKELQIPD